MNEKLRGYFQSDSEGDFVTILQEEAKATKATKALKQEREANPVLVGSVNFHISNSGVKFSVVDEGWGPTIEVSGSAFGNMNSSLKLHTDRTSLAILAKLFLDAAQHEEYTDDYSNKARASRIKDK